MTQLKALVSFSYQNQSFKNGQEFTVEDKKEADFLLRSGHVVEAGQEQARAAHAAQTKKAK